MSFRVEVLLGGKPTTFFTNEECFISMLKHQIARRLSICNIQNNDFEIICNDEILNEKLEIRNSPLKFNPKCSIRMNESVCELEPISTPPLPPWRKPEAFPHNKVYGHREIDAGFPDLGSVFDDINTPPSVMPLDPQNEALAIYEDTIHMVCDWAKGIFPNLNSICLMLFSSRAFVPHRHTLVFTFNPGHQDEVDRLAEQFRERFPQYPLDIATLAGTPTRRMSGTLTGASIGVQGVDWTRGTSGGVVTRDKTKYVLTCRHVTHPVNEVTGLMSTGPIELPSQRSRDEAKAALNKEYEDSNKRYESHKQLKNNPQWAPFMRPEQEAILKAERDAAKSLSDAADAAHTSSVSNYLRKVVFTEATHQATVDGDLMEIDWSLVEINDQTKAAAGNQFDIKGGKIKRIPRLQHSNAFVVTGDGPPRTFLPMMVGDWVCKAGARTGVTEGVYCGRFDQVRFPGAADFTREHYVLSDPSDGGIKFASPGDSGAFVMNRHGQVIGLLFGGMCVQQPYRTYFTPIDVVSEAIERVTGKPITVCPANVTP